MVCGCSTLPTVRRSGFSGCNAPAGYESESCVCANAAIARLRLFEPSKRPRDKEPLRLVLPSLGQTQLGARQGGVGERLKAILVFLFDLAMSFDEPKLMRGGSR